MLENAGKVTVSKSGKGLVFACSNRVIVERFVFSKKQMQELIDGKRVWIRASKIVGVGKTY